MMWKVGTILFASDAFVNYSPYGICRVEAVQPMKFDSSGKRDYYVLKPVYQSDASVFVPVGNQKLESRMRPILFKGEIDQIIDSVKDDGMQWIEDRKQRAAQMKEILTRRDERELLLLISCLYYKSQEGTKGLAAGDAQVMKAAEGMISQEFSFSLGLPPEEIGGYIQTRLED